MESQKEPTLEEYGLDAISYLKHRKKIEELISIKKSFCFTFWNYIFYIILPLLLILYFIFNLSFFISIIISVVCLMFFEMVRDFFNKRNESYKETENRIKSYKENTNIEAFENTLLKFCSDYIEHYYNNYVFRKHVGRNEGMKLASLMKEAKNITEHFDKNSYTVGYKEYLINRFNINPYIDYEKNSNYFKFSKILNSINNIEIKNEVKINTNNENVLETKNTKEVNYTEEQKNIINKIDLVKKESKQEFNFLKYMPPEKRYVTPRKIDNWEEINKKRKETGDKGEEIAMAIEIEFLESVNRKDLADKVRHVSVEVGDGLGYDVLSFWENGKEKYIEVKSTTVSINSPFNLSKNELGFLQEHHEDAFIYRILISDEAPEFVAYASYEVLEGKITPVSFTVKME